MTQKRFTKKQSHKRIWLIIGKILAGLAAIVTIIQFTFGFQNVGSLVNHATTATSTASSPDCGSPLSRKGLFEQNLVVKTGCVGILNAFIGDVDEKQKWSQDGGLVAFIAGNHHIDFKDGGIIFSPNFAANNAFCNEYQQTLALGGRLQYVQPLPEWTPCQGTTTTVAQ